MDQNLGRAHNASGPGKDDDISWTEKFHADKDAYHGVRLSWYTLLGGNINHTKGITFFSEEVPCAILEKVSTREAVSENEKPLVDTLEADWVINRHYCQYKLTLFTIFC